jgi:VWFA-related protein
VPELSKKKRPASWLVILGFCLAAITASAQSQPGQPPKQDIPDAPSASRPPQPFPSTPPPANPTARSATDANSKPEPPPAAAPASESETPTPRPPLNIKTVPEGGATPEGGTAQEDLYKITTNVNQVLVPVMVKDDNGRLTSGLLPKDFSVYEDGVKQKMNFFTSDPFALSAAVIFDLGMPDSAVQKVNQTFPALEGAFSQFDEVAIYTYSSTFAKATDFAAVGQQLTATLNSLKTVTGRNNGPPVTSGPLGPQGPIINGVPVGSPVTPTVTPPKESHVLNDVVLAAALDLAKRDRTRRKIIFIISDGREYGSQAGYSDVLKVLLSHGIIVYGVGTEGSAIPLYNKLERLHLPHYGYSNILPKYASATGGEIFPEFSRPAIEATYARAIGDARNQYTLGYVIRGTPSTAYRQIEVRVDRPGCRTSNLSPCVDVVAKDGYYPLPPTR